MLTATISTAFYREREGKLKGVVKLTLPIDEFGFVNYRLCDGDVIQSTTGTMGDNCRELTVTFIDTLEETVIEDVNRLVTLYNKSLRRAYYSTANIPRPSTINFHFETGIEGLDD